MIGRNAIKAPSKLSTGIFVAQVWMCWSYGEMASYCYFLILFYDVVSFRAFIRTLYVMRHDMILPRCGGDFVVGNHCGSGPGYPWLAVGSCRPASNRRQKGRKIKICKTKPTETAPVPLGPDFDAIEIVTQRPKGMNVKIRKTKPSGCKLNPPMQLQRIYSRAGAPGHLPVIL